MAEEIKKIFQTDKRIKLGIWGLGRGGNFLKCCEALNIDVVAGCDFNDHIREEFAKTAPGVFLTADEDEFLAQDIDAVLIATWFFDHAKHAIKALNAGKHVMCEVTSFYNPAEGVELVEAVEKSGKVYNLLENYPFMKNSLMAKGLWDEGLFGEFVYGEFDYNHDCRCLPFAYIDGSPVQPGWALHSWRSWLNGQLYNTHSLGPVMHITSLRPVKVSAPKASCLMPGKIPGKRADVCPSFVTMSNGGLLRNLMGSISGDTHAKRLWGTRGACDFTEDFKIRIGSRGCSPTVKLQSEWPELGKLADEMGHGGGDFWELYFFAREILTGEKAFWNVYRACDVTLTGIMATRSQELDGAAVEVPDFRDPAVREKYRNDRKCDAKPDTERMLFPDGHDKNITRDFNTVMTQLVPWILWDKEQVAKHHYGYALVRQAFDGMKLYPRLADDASRMQVLKDVRMLIRALPDFAPVWRKARMIADAYPGSPAAHVLNSILEIAEEQAVLDTEATLTKLRKWLETCE